MSKIDTIPNIEAVNQFTPLRQHLHDTFHLCRYVVPAVVVCDLNAEKFLQMKRQGSRTAYYLQALSRVLADHPRVNAGFARDFWTNNSRIVQWNTVAAAVSVDKKFGDERFPFIYVIKDSHKKTIKEIDGILTYLKETPVEGIPEFRNFLKFLKLPRFVRRMLMWHMVCNPDLMKERIGTFNFTSLAFWGFRGASMPTPRLLVGMGAPDDDNKNIRMGYSFNHVITDGAQIGEFHRDLNRFFRKCEFE